MKRMKQMRVGMCEGIGMIALLLAAAAASGAAIPPDRAACVATPARCLPAPARGASLGFSDSSVSRYDPKMEAYRLDPRPCRVVGNLDCPPKSKPIWKLGEPVGHTLARSLGLR